MKSPKYSDGNVPNSTDSFNRKEILEACRKIQQVFSVCCRHIEDKVWDERVYYALQNLKSTISFIDWALDNCIDPLPTPWGDKRKASGLSDYMKEKIKSRFKDPSTGEAIIKEIEEINR